MALLTFPFTLAQFALILLIKNFAWRLQAQEEISGLASGQILATNLGPDYWMARVALDSMTHREAAEIQSLVQALGSMGSFYMHDPRNQYPAYDPTGSIIGANTVRILEIASNNREMKWKGMTSGYQVRRGDFFHRDFGASPVHRAYHQVVSSSVAADGSGNTGFIEFRPPLLPGAAVNDIITIKQPAAQVTIVPKSFVEGQPARSRNYGMTFDIRQVL